MVFMPNFIPHLLPQRVREASALWWGVVITLPVVALLVVSAYYVYYVKPAKKQAEYALVESDPLQCATRDFASGRIKLYSVMNNAKKKEEPYFHSHTLSADGLEVCFGEWDIPGKVSEYTLQTVEVVRISSTYDMTGDPLVTMPYFEKARAFVIAYNSEMNRLLEAADK